MPLKEIPGFYFDVEKNRYFRLRGPIPGSMRRAVASSSSSSLPDPGKVHLLHEEGRKRGRKSSKLLQVRELHGGSLTSRRICCNFKQEYQKLQAARPIVWEYDGTSCVADSALEQLHGVIQTHEGLMETTLLATGSTKGSFSLFEVGKLRQFFNYGQNCMPKLVWPPVLGHRTGLANSLESIWTSREASTSFSSNISCIKRIGKHATSAADDGPSLQNALVTTLGSGISGGSVCVLNLRNPLDFSRNNSLRRRTSEIYRLNCTIWSADCNSNGTHAIVGTDSGAALLNLETRGLSWVHRSKSAILSQRFDQSGNIVLCGFRNGAIVVVDIRQKQSECFERSTRYPRRTMGMPTTAHAAGFRQGGRSKKRRYEPPKHWNTMLMSSAVCSLVTLQTDDQYFLGSSMDGNIKLFDIRLLHRGAIQSYQGHVNSHSHLHLGVDPSETLVMSGGEDCCLRIWSIKTSELIFGAKISSSVLATVCWPQFGDSAYGNLGSHSNESLYEATHSWGAWLGSHEGLFYIHDS